MKDNSLENEMTADKVLRSVFDSHEYCMADLPYHVSLEATLKAMETYATLKTSQLKEQLEEAKKSIEALKKVNENQGEQLLKKSGLIPALSPEDSQEEKRHYWIYERNNLLEQLEKLQEELERRHNDFLKQLKQSQEETSLLKSQLEDSVKDCVHLTNRIREYWEPTVQYWKDYSSDFHRQLEEAKAEIERLKTIFNQ